MSSYGFNDGDGENPYELIWLVTAMVRIHVNSYEFSKGDGENHVLDTALINSSLIIFLETKRW